MNKLKLLLIFLFGLFALCFADETLTITTYYPSPYGSYQDLYVANTLGIGTTAPTGPLQVTVGTTGARLTTTDFTLSSAGSVIVQKMGAATGNTYGEITVKRSGGTAVANLVLQGDGGNVGIGTTSPSATLDINGTIRGATYGFGGFYSTCNDGCPSCQVANPVTGSWNCPAGFTANLIQVNNAASPCTGGPDQSYLFMCWK